MEGASDEEPHRGIINCLPSEAQFTRCEDEPIHIPGAVQNFGCMLILKEEIAEDDTDCLTILQASENCGDILGIQTDELFQLSSFYDYLEEGQADVLCENLGSLPDSPHRLASSGPRIFSLFGWDIHRDRWDCWCAAHEMQHESHERIIILEFEPIVKEGLVATDTIFRSTSFSQMEIGHTEGMAKPPYTPTGEQRRQSTQQESKPLRSLERMRAQGKGRRRGRGTGKGKEDHNADSVEKIRGSFDNLSMTNAGESGGSSFSSSMRMELGAILGQINEQLSSQEDMDSLFKTTVGIMKDVSTFSRAAIYQFDQEWNGQVVAELVDDKVTSDFFQGLHFPAADIPSQARELYKVNRVRMLYDRDAKTARMVCRDQNELKRPVHMTYSCLRAMSPIHSLYLENMGIRSSMSVSITAFDRLWGLVIMHSYGRKGRRLSFPMRQLCLQIGDSITENIERISQKEQVTLRRFVSLAVQQDSPRKYLLQKVDRLLDMFQATYGILSIDMQTLFMGDNDWPKECFEAYIFLQKEALEDIVITDDAYTFLPALYLGIEPNLTQRALIIPLSSSGKDFLAVFRKTEILTRSWAGKPRELTSNVMVPRSTFESWSDTIKQDSTPWEQDKRDAATMLKLKLCG